VAALVLVASAVYALGAVRRVFHGPPLASGADLRWRERLLVIPLLVLVVALGVAPRALTDRIGDDALPSADRQR
jgi:NADH:ubiquinone oxidoreductase subunit 4 (subunit M)